MASGVTRHPPKRESSTSSEGSRSPAQGGKPKASPNVRTHAELRDPLRLAETRDSMRSGAGRKTCPFPLTVGFFSDTLVSTVRLRLLQGGRRWARKLHPANIGAGRDSRRMSPQLGCGFARQTEAPAPPSRTGTSSELRAVPAHRAGTLQSRPTRSPTLETA